MKYRPEIDGLRAVAVLPVIFFHAGFEPFRGGFVGVDVFFVISGYLITSLILEELKIGRFSVANFYDRRARRILPALFFVVLCSIPVAWVLLLPKSLNEFFQSVMAVSVFSSNILFWWQSGYFDTGAELKPLLHTWSLAVEEQFYIIFPLLLMALWRFYRSMVFWILLGLCVVSLGYAHWGAYTYPSATFFLLPARGWELLIGSLAAYRLQHGFSAPPNLTSNLLSAAGLLAIAYAVVDFNERTPFPSLYALAPTVGTALVILFAVPGTVVYRLLSLKACVGIGLISYSMYLWHQPIFVFARYITALPEGSYVFLALTVLTTALAFFSWRFVERPFRTKKFPVARVLSGAALASVAVLALGFALPKLANQTADETDYMTHWQGWTACYPFGSREEAGGGCRIMDATRAPTMAVIGDSHAGHLASGIREFYEGSDENVLILLSGGCYPTVSRATDSEDFMQCEQGFMDKAIAHVIADPDIAKVIVSGYGNLELLGNQAFHGTDFAASDVPGRQELLTDGLIETIGGLMGAGKKVLFITDNPEMIEHPAHCSTRFASLLGTCPHKVSQSEFEERSQPMNAVTARVQAAFPDLQVVDGKTVFCDGSYCYSGSAEANWYQNRHHLTPTGSLMLVEHALGGF
ncbi:MULTISPECIES: acyltransferase family protein [unclassified Roseovarius]|uniref:acyltransferase family protein n=1 Tax=unclassified Roseovarius TaxID=2614913 RepID=UPI00273FE53B|nr:MULTISPECIES: acyltransferase family protein [unclassified Roseovarius]